MSTNQNGGVGNNDINNSNNGTGDVVQEPKVDDNGAGQAVDPVAEAEKWKALSRKNESELDKVRKELDQIKASQMTDSEKALEAAKSDGRKAALEEFGTRLAEAEIRATAANQGRKVPEGLEGFLNLTAFVGDDGNPNKDAITAFINSLPENSPGGPKFSQNVGIGPQGGSGVTQLTRADMARMTPQQIVKAREEGKFSDLLNGTNP